MWWLHLVAAGIGLIVGSFVNTVADRLPRGQSVVCPRSHCPACRRTLAVWELLPALSYLLLMGRCRTCGAGIGWRTPAVELVTGAAALTISIRIGFGPAGGLALAVCASLIALAVIDLETGFLPDVIDLPLAGGGLIWSGLAGPGWIDSILGFLICGGLLWLVGFAYLRLTGRVGLGGGDPKLAAGIGAWLGPELGLYSLVWGAGVGALVGLGLVAAGRAGFKTALPFGPFLALSGMVWLLLKPPF